MIPGIENTPPEVAMALGFFMALSLRRGTVKTLVERWTGTGNETKTGAAADSNRDRNGGNDGSRP